MKLYKVNKYDKYITDEVSVEWHEKKPVESVFYKYDILEEVEIELPEGVTHKDILVLFNDNGRDCIMINNKDCTVCVVSAELNDRFVLGKFFQPYRITVKRIL